MKKVLRILFKVFYPILLLLPIKQNTILFESFLGRKVNDSPRAIFEYLKKQYPDMEFIWAVNTPDELQIDGARMIKRMSLKYFVEVSRAKYIVNNSRMPIFFKKRNKQVYLQTWHGTPLKKLVYDMEKNVMPNTTKDKYLKSFSKEVENWDYLISPNKYSTECFKSAFRFKKTILEVGYPRNEALHHYTDLDRSQLREKYGFNSEDKVVLYTPTYRDNKNSGKGSYLQDIKLDLELLNKTDGIKVMLRLHYLIAQSIDFKQYDNIYDVSAVDDINELFVVSDVLLNDYSSTMFDYLILNKPIILFPYDLEQYENDIRGFYMEYNDLPAEQIKTTERLIEIVDNLDGYHSIWQEQLNEFREMMVLETEREATKTIVEQIKQKKY